MLIRINFDSETFFNSWEKGFLKVIEAVGDKNKIIINKVFWSTRMNGGNEIMSSNINYINRGNIQLEKLYEIALRYIPIEQFIEYPRDIFFADENHKWGISPFHYVSEVYDYFLNQLILK